MLNSNKLIFFSSTVYLFDTRLDERQENMREETEAKSTRSKFSYWKFETRCFSSSSGERNFIQGKLNQFFTDESCLAEKSSRFRAVHETLCVLIPNCSHWRSLELKSAGRSSLKRDKLNYLLIILISGFEEKFFNQLCWILLMTKWKLQLSFLFLGFSSPGERTLDAGLSEPRKNGSKLYRSTSNYYDDAIPPSDVENVAGKLRSIADYFPFRKSINLTEWLRCILLQSM